MTNLVLESKKKSKVNTRLQNNLCDMFKIREINIAKISIISGYNVLKAYVKDNKFCLTLDSWSGQTRSD